MHQVQSHVLYKQKFSVSVLETFEDCLLCFQTAQVTHKCLLVAVVTDASDVTVRASRAQPLARLPPPLVGRRLE